MTTDIVSTPDTIALVQGEPWSTLPGDLYIPPNALKVVVENFSGPLDLLLYLIRKQNLNILDIPIATITTQYLEYINFIQGLRLDLATEYLTMATWLTEIKSRMLLPQLTTTDKSIDDPRNELVRQLHEYEQIQRTAQALDALPRLERDIFLATAALPNLQSTRTLPTVTLEEFLDAMHAIFRQVELFHKHCIEKEPLSVQDRILAIQNALTAGNSILFTQLFTLNEGRTGAVVTFIAVLELVKNGLIKLTQEINYGIILIQALEH